MQTVENNVISVTASPLHFVMHVRKWLRTLAMKGFEKSICKMQSDQCYSVKSVTHSVMF